MSYTRDRASGWRRWGSGGCGVSRAIRHNICAVGAVVAGGVLLCPRGVVAEWGDAARLALAAGQRIHCGRGRACRLGVQNVARTTPRVLLGQTRRFALCGPAAVGRIEPGLNVARHQASSRSEQDSTLGSLMPSRPSHSDGPSCRAAGGPERPWRWQRLARCCRWVHLPAAVRATG